MSRLFIGNFDFERQLVTVGEPSRTVRRLNDELAAVWLSVAEEGDYIACGAAPEEEFLLGLAKLGIPPARFVKTPSEVAGGNVTEIVPWGWSAPVIRQVRALGVDYTGPEPGVISFANSRRFSTPLELELQSALPLAGEVGTLEELAQRLQQFRAFAGEDDQWLLKANWGHAGRERIAGRGTKWEPQVEHWITSRIARDGVVFFEPFVDSAAEAGMQWTIPRHGSPRLDGIVPLHSTPQGGYLGSVVVPQGTSQTEWNEAVQIQTLVLERLQALGYWGPVGIDAMQYRFQSADIRLRAAQDVNARWTMGRIAQAWGKRLAPQAGGTWWHAPSAPGPQALATSPTSIGGIPVQHRTWWL